jgi:hypothetical protein
LDSAPSFPQVSELKRTERSSRVGARDERRLTAERLREWQTCARERGQLSLRCSPGKFYIGKCGSHLRETVRPHSKITGNGLTPRPSGYAPDRSAGLVGESAQTGAHYRDASERKATVLAGKLEIIKEDTRGQSQVLTQKARQRQHLDGSVFGARLCAPQPRETSNCHTHD